MGKKKNKPSHKDSGLDTELIRMYMMGGANPSSGNKLDNAGDIIDLHFESQSGGKKIAASDILFGQLDEFEKAMDKAIAAGKLEFRVVHGLGKGRLKDEIFKILDKHPQVKSYKNEYHSRYGFGSTIIYFY